MDGPVTEGIRVDRFGERALQVQVGDQLLVQALADALVAAIADGRLDDVTPGDESILLQFDGTDAGERRARRALSRAVDRTRDTAWMGARPVPRRWIVPVRYGGADGPDLAESAAMAGCTPDELIAMHTGQDYPVRFIGFAPGFPYLGDLPVGLALPRLSVPRTRTPAGSVAIAERYTGIYPADLPGGWRVIGRTTFALFDPFVEPPARLLPGDLVRFEQV